MSSSSSRRWSLLFVVCTTVVALVGAGIYVGLRESRYDSTADVLVAPLATDDPEFQGLPLIRESSDGSRPVQTAAGLLRGPAIAEATAKGLGTDWTTAKVEGAVQVQPRGESNIVAITAEAEDPDEAARVANRYAHIALELRRRAIAPALEREIEALEGQPDSGVSLQRLEDAQENGDPTLSVASAAQPPSSSSLISTKLVLLAALIVGLLVGVAGVMIFDVARASPEEPSRA